MRILTSCHLSVKRIFLITSHLLMSLRRPGAIALGVSGSSAIALSQLKESCQ